MLLDDQSNGTAFQQANYTKTIQTAGAGFLQLKVEALEARLRDPVSNSETCVLDVRKQDEYKRGHIPGPACGLFYKHCSQPALHT